MSRIEASVRIMSKAVWVLKGVAPGKKFKMKVITSCLNESFNVAVSRPTTSTNFRI